MSTQKAINAFLACKKIAVVGASRSKECFGQTVYVELKKHGYTVFPINPHTDEILGDKAYPALSALPEKPDGVIFVVPPAETEKVLPEVFNLGIKNVWLQQGSESVKVVRMLKENKIDAVTHDCIFMFLKDTEWFHKMHRGIKQVFGGLYSPE